METTTNSSANTQRRKKVNPSKQAYKKLAEEQVVTEVSMERKLLPEEQMHSL